MIKQLFPLILMGLPFYGYSQANVYCSSGENSENGLTISYAVDEKLNLESDDGMFSSGPLVSYTYVVAATTGLDQEEISLLTVYPNPIANVLVLKTGELKDVLFSISNANGATLESFTIQAEETFIDFSNYLVGVYYLTLFQNGEPIKSFSIIKK